MNPLIKFNNICRHFGNQDVLKGLSFSVEPGKVFAFLGRNGAGKTTALRILLGFLKPSFGESKLLGQDSQKLSPVTRDRIGYISEGHRLFSYMRIKDAVAFEAGTRKSFSRSYAEKAIARCELPPNKFIIKLSRGERAQLALILAVSGSPDVIIFDDPAMGLDVVMRREFLDVMIDMLADRGCSVLFSSHILTDVERIADQVGILHDGQLIVNAAIEDLKTRVERRRWTTGNTNLSNLPKVEGLLNARKIGGGYDLTLLDMTPEKEIKLRQNDASLDEPNTLSLEELFLDLTAGRNESEVVQ